MVRSCRGLSYKCGAVTGTYARFLTKHPGHFRSGCSGRSGLKTVTIYEDSGVSPYLTRHYLTPDADWWRSRLPGVFLHWFHRGDLDRELHSHPWAWSFSLILWGGYEEERVLGGGDWRRANCYATLPPVIERRSFAPLSMNFLRETTFHRVTLLDPRGSLTLFIAGPKVALPKGATWGFLSRDGLTYETIAEREARVMNDRREREAFGREWARSINSAIKEGEPSE